MDGYYSIYGLQAYRDFNVDDGCNHTDNVEMILVIIGFTMANEAMPYLSYKLLPKFGWSVLDTVYADHNCQSLPVAMELKAVDRSNVKK